MTSTTFNISQAARMVGKNRATLQRAIKRGDLSFTVDGSGYKRIDASELVRCFPDDFDPDNDGEQGKGKDDLAELRNNKKLEAMQEKLEAQYKAEIERLEEALKRAQEGQNKVIMLLEDQSDKGGEWKSSINQMAERVASLQEDHKREMHKLKRALRAERDKTLWRKLFG